jgi:hypothetical protein
LLPFDLSFPGFLQFSEQLVVHFPAHRILHHDGIGETTTRQYKPEFPVGNS